MGTEENKAIQRRIIDKVINGRNLDMADELFSEDHALHPYSRAFAGLHEEFPDVRVEIESMVAEGDMVAVRLAFSGAHGPVGRVAGDGLRALLRAQGCGELGGHWYRTQLG